MRGAEEVSGLLRGAAETILAGSTTVEVRAAAVHDIATVGSVLALLMREHPELEDELDEIVTRVRFAALLQGQELDDGA